MIKRVIKFIEEDIWNINTARKHRLISLLIKSFRITITTLKSYTRDNVPQKAASLTYYTVLSLVPIMALIFGISKGFGVESSIENYFYQNFSEQKEILEWTLTFSRKLLENAKGGFIAGVGFVVLFWSVLKVLSNIESSFNSIWGVTRARTWSRKFADYFSILFIAPVLIIVVSSTNVFISTELNKAAQEITVLGYLTPFISFLLKLIPYVLLWMLLSLVYMIMPNTKVKPSSAIIAGIIAGTAFQLTQWGYIHFQIGVNKYNSIYGGFAAIPLLLIWLNLSWLIVLLGAEISFNLQHKRHIDNDISFDNLSWRNKKRVLLVVYTYIIKNFLDDKQPISSRALEKKLGLPVIIINESLQFIIKTKLITEVKIGKVKHKCYLPTTDPSKVKVSDIIYKFESLGINKNFINTNDTKLNLDKIMDQLKAEEELSDSNILIGKI
jgi:membrane protein